MRFIVALAVALPAIFHAVVCQDTSTTPFPVYNGNGFNAGNMNGVPNPGNVGGGVNPGNVGGGVYPGNVGGGVNPGNVGGGVNPGYVGNADVNNYPNAAGAGPLGGDTSTTAIPGFGVNAFAGVTAGNSVLGGGNSDSDSEEDGDSLGAPGAAESSSIAGGAAQEAGDSPDSPDEVDGGGRGGGNAVVRGDNNGLNEIGDTPDDGDAQNIVDVDMGEQVGASSTGATAGILIGVVAVVAAVAGVGIYVVKQRRNSFSSSNV